MSDHNRRCAHHRHRATRRGRRINVDVVVTCRADVDKISGHGRPITDQRLYLVGGPRRRAEVTALIVRIPLEVRDLVLTEFFLSAIAEDECRYDATTGSHTEGATKPMGTTIIITLCKNR